MHIFTTNVRFCLQKVYGFYLANVCVFCKIFLLFGRNFIVCLFSSFLKDENLYLYFVVFVFLRSMGTILIDMIERKSAKMHDDFNLLELLYTKMKNEYKKNQNCIWQLRGSIKLVHETYRLLLLHLLLFIVSTGLDAELLLLYRSTAFFSLSL